MSLLDVVRERGERHRAGIDGWAGGGELRRRGEQHGERRRIEPLPGTGLDERALATAAVVDADALENARQIGLRGDDASDGRVG